MPDERIAVVTGASSGIGEATARLLTERGWRCVLVARREDRLRALAAEIGGEVEVCDVSDRDAVDALAARILARHPAVHLLMNNAGIHARGTFLTIDLDRVRRVMEVNYLGGVWCTRALMPGLEAAAASGGAHVVNLVSVAGTAAFAPSGAYASAKHAQLAFSRSLAASLRGSGIAVHAVLPGFVETEGFPQKGVLRSRLYSYWDRQVICSNRPDNGRGDDCPVEAHDLKFDRTEISQSTCAGSKDYWYHAYYMGTTTNLNSTDAAQLKNQLLWAGGTSNPFLTFDNVGANVKIDPLDGTTGGSSSGSGSTDVASNPVWKATPSPGKWVCDATNAEKNVGAACTCNGLNRSWQPKPLMAGWFVCI